MSKPDHQGQTGHQHCSHDHAHNEHANHEHAHPAHSNDARPMSAHAGDKLTGHSHDDHDHTAHDHAAHDHSGHDHDHAAHSHAGHSHAHGHGHHHHGDPLKQGRAFAVAIALNSIFVVIEFAYGFIANSTALMADAGHNLSDVMGLALAWGAAILSKRRPSGRYTYGLRSTSMLAALFNAMLLMVACGAIVWEAVQQLFAPQQVAGVTVSVVAAIGIAVNGLSAWMLLAGSKDDLNARGAYLHMAADAAVSLGVLVSGLVVMYTGWSWLDPAVSIAIVIVIVLGTWSLLRDSLRMMLAAVPDNVDAPKVEQFLRGGAGVSDVHDLHIWAMSTTETALTAHLVMPNGYPGDKTIDDIRTRLREDYAIQHSTLQVEQGTTAHACCLEATIKEA